MVTHQLDHQRRDILRQRVRISGIVGDMDLADSGDLRRRLGDGVDALADDEQVNLAQLRGRRHRGQGGIPQLAVFMLDENQRLHQITPTVRRRSISSSTDCTLTPASRLEGSRTPTVVSLGAVSTP